MEVWTYSPYRCYIFIIMGTLQEIVDLADAMQLRGEERKDFIAKEREARLQAEEREARMRAEEREREVSSVSVYMSTSMTVVSCNLVDHIGSNLMVFVIVNAVSGSCLYIVRGPLPVRCRFSIAILNAPSQALFAS